jgi:hypothetical protein
MIFTHLTHVSSFLSLGGVQDPNKDASRWEESSGRRSKGPEE